MKIALAHDSFTQMGGAERVVDAFHEMFPEAPVFSLVLDSKFKEKYKGWDIRTSWLQIFYNFIPKLQYLLPLIPPAVSSLDFSGYDVVLSSSSSFIKNIRVPKNCVHINYCHTPTRFLWSDSEYVNQEVPIIIRPMVKWLLSRMKKWDFKGAQRVTKFIANSKEVQNRIKRYYNREGQIIYPFVDTQFWKPANVVQAPGLPKKDSYFLLAGRLQAHKKNDLIVKIFNELNLPLHVVGSGRQLEYLESIAKSNISFLEKNDDAQLRDEYRDALGFIYPQTEDFGLMPLEAASCGTATLAYGHGGALETILPGVTGEFFENYDSEKIKQMILNWNPQKYGTGELRNQAEKFGKDKFKSAILNFINSANENRN